MISATPVPATDEDRIGQKKAWVEPTVVEFDLGQAEANDGTGTDGGQIS